MPKIPKTIHFIWAGGTLILPKDGMKNVRDWAEANPDFQVKIWVDKATDPNYQKKYDELFDDKTIFPNGKPNNIEFVDITEQGVVTPEIRYELDGLWPNYGASSDMLRYIILSKEGGACFDPLDVKPHPNNPLIKAAFPDHQTVFDSDLIEHRFLMHVTKHSAVKNKEMPGTEALICTPGCPEMKKLAEQAQSSYHENKSQIYKNMAYKYNHPRGRSKNIDMSDEHIPKAVTRTKSENFPHESYSSHSSLKSSPNYRIGFLRSSPKEFKQTEAKLPNQDDVTLQRGKDTLSSTGPLMAIDVLKGNEKEVPRKYLMPHDEKGISDWVTLPKDHAAHWAKMRIVAHDRNEAIKTAINSLFFEIENMGVLNITAHVEQIVCAIINFKPSELDNAEELNKSINIELRKKFIEDPRFKILESEGLLKLNPGNNITLNKQEMPNTHTFK